METELSIQIVRFTVSGHGRPQAILTAFISDPSIHTIYLMYLDAGLNTLVTQYAIPREHLLEPLKEYVTAFFGGVKVEILGNYCEIVSKKEGSVTLSVLKKTFELRTRVLNGQTQIMSADAYEVLNFVKTTLPNGNRSFYCHVGQVCLTNPWFQRSVWRGYSKLVFVRTMGPRIQFTGKLMIKDD
jgi:hypothetical protein